MKTSDNYPAVSIIITNYNGERHLEECLNSLKDIEYSNYEVILLDNASSDNSIGLAREHYPEIKIIALDKNYGFAEGTNKGAQAAESEFIVFLNNDTKVDRKWLRELVNAVKTYGEDNVYSSKVLFYDPPHNINTVGGIITPMGSGLDINFAKPDLDKYNEIKYVGSPSGCSMLLKKSLFEKMGGFDKDYFAYLEDVDFGWRSWLYGHKTYYIPTSIVYHKYGATGGKMESPFRVFHVQKNRLTNILKNFSIRNILSGFIISIGFDIIRILGFLAGGNFDLIKAVFKGNYYFIKNIPKTLKKRKKIQRNRKIPDSQMFEMDLIASLSWCIKEFRRLGKLNKNSKN
ncbi:MAG: glycosyltransferase family 2 protein [Methanobacterium sp.]|nr:glycosyltransferase family 2 protein [Methanobacterium sp.]